jgi:hypothetical protein
MRTTLLITATLASVIVLGSAIVDAQPIMGPPGTTVYGNAPIGHLQPRAEQFVPRSPAEQTVQRRQSEYDAQQQKLDEQLDKTLNICRRC